MYFPDDERIARSLQQTYNPGPISGHKSAYEKQNQNPIDNRLEYDDPTPSIHELFMVFDRRFFWNKLGMVEVKWSNRMTTCAGLCYYQGRNGLCSIKLSAPLLSLRPRKDLVETLLHEMIHAYLFITHNFRDREDHGPEFHKHMNRINKDAGTKITVYHTFLDEVAFYQKHVWRCNGPCRNQRPYFGFVKRAMNRAPGPYDSWWESHQQRCGGTYTKISEPEKTNKKKKSEQEKGKTNVKDIRKFFPSGNTTNAPISSNLHRQKTDKSNIHTFKDLPSGGCQGGLKTYNGGQTVTINKRKSPESKQNINPVNNPTPKTCPTFERDKGVIQTVRNVWANKYPSSSNKTPSPNEVGNGKRVVDVEEYSPIKAKKREVKCPICDLAVDELEINDHVDECLNRGSSNLDDTIPMDELHPPKAVIAAQKLSDSDAIPDDLVIELADEEEENSLKEIKLELANCPVCNKTMEQKSMNDHLENCVKCSFINEKDNFDPEEVACESVPCPCCYKWFSESSINAHIDECLTLIALRNS